MKKTGMFIAVVLACGVVMAEDTNNVCQTNRVFVVGANSSPDISSVTNAPSERKQDVRIVLVRMACPCGGEMKPTGECLTSYPPQYPHKCDKCGRNVTFNVCYPELRYEY